MDAILFGNKNSTGSNEPTLKSFWYFIFRLYSLLWIIYIFCMHYTHPLILILYNIYNHINNVIPFFIWNLKWYVRDRAQIFFAFIYYIRVPFFPTPFLSLLYHELDLKLTFNFFYLSVSFWQSVTTNKLSRDCEEF